MSKTYGLNNNTKEENLEEVIMRTGGLGLPTGSMNIRRSAHFLEINSIYGAEMTRRVRICNNQFEHAYQSIKDQRETMSDKDKKTKYAVQGYSYSPSAPAEYLN